VGPRPSTLVVASDRVIPSQSDGVVMAWLESSLGVENGLVEPSPEDHAPKLLHIAWTLVRDRLEVLMRALKATRRV
jgi:hypothetical protein